MRARLFPRVEWPLVGLWIAAAGGLAVITTQVRDWFVMTDELVYERLAIAIARTGSPLPTMHGELVRSLDQLYPLVIAPFFASGLVPHDLAQAHFLNAWLMTSTCIPVFLLARRVTRSRGTAYALAVLAILTPWLLYSPFLMTEVVAYPAFAWAMLGLQRATASPSARNDVLALAGITLAFLARTQFLVLVLIFPLTLLAVERRPRAAARAHPVALACTGALVLAGLGLVAAGGNLATLTVYGQEVQGGLLPPGTATWYLRHLAMLALGLGILPFVVGVAWLLANVVRPGDRELRAFACLGSLTVVLLPLEVTSYDLHVGGGIARDRYLFYVAPLVLVAFAASLLDRRRPRWSLLAPTAAVGAGFALGPEADYAWNDAYARLNSDTVISGLFRPLVHALGGMGTTRAVLAVATAALSVLFVLGSAMLSRRRLLLVAGVLVLAGLPAETGYLFDRLLSVDGTASRPLTRSPAARFDWVDKTAGTQADVTMVPAPIDENYFETQQYWRDLEFWNKSVVRDAHAPGDPFSFTGLWFPKLELQFDPVTGRANRSPTSYVVEALKETRFRVSGPTLNSTSDAMLIRADEPWRASWLTFGLYDDGWTEPGVTARVRVFAAPGQPGPRVRYLTLQIWAPSGVERRPFTVRSNLQSREGVGGSATAVVGNLHVCVPADGFADVALTVHGQSPIPGDLASTASSVGARQGGLFLAQIALADETGVPCRAARTLA